MLNYRPPGVFRENFLSVDIISLIYQYVHILKLSVIKNYNTSIEMQSANLRKIYCHGDRPDKIIFKKL